MVIQRIRSNIKIPAVILGSLILIYLSLCVVILPKLLISKIPELIEQDTGRKSLVTKIQIQPFPLAISVQGFEMQEADGAVFAQFANFYIRLGLIQSIQQSTLVIEQLILTKPLVHIVRQKQGDFNFQGLVKVKADDKQNKGALFPLSILQLKLEEGQLIWEDFSSDKLVKETLAPINLSIENISTQADQQAHINLSLALSSGGVLNWQGLAGLNPKMSEGHVQLDYVHLETLLALANQNYSPLKVTGNELVAADYKATYTDLGWQFIVTQGVLELHDVQVLEENTAKLLINMPVFAMHGIALDLKKQSLLIESVSIDNADIQASLTPEGVLNYQSLLPANTSNPVNAPQKAPWLIKVNSVVVNNGALNFEDQTLKKPLTIAIKPIAFKLINLSNQADTQMPVQLSLGINQTGLITLNGNATLKPTSANLALDVKNVDLENFQSYVDKFIHLDVIDGGLHINGQLSIAGIDVSKPDIKFKGNAGIDHLLTRDQTLRKDFIKWSGLTLTNLDIDLLPQRYTATALLIDKPYVRVTIKKDKTTNFSDFIVRDKSKPSIQKNAVNTKQSLDYPVYFKLDKIQVTEGSSDFSDLSLILPFAAEIKSLDGGASGLSSDKKSIIKLALEGNAYDLSPVNIKGEMSPYLGDFNIAINFNELPMPLVSPYMVQFAGYKVEKGQMTLGLKYNVSHHDLTASNSILINQFELGDKVDNPNAVVLPLKLAVALLKDSDGKIKIDVPISGSLDDPKFSISALVEDALLNMLSKIVTSPFRALASLIGSEEDLSTVSFPAGHSYLTKAQQAKLDELALALKARANLTLDIKGAAFIDQDWLIIREDALYEQLKRRRAIEINQNADKKIRHEYVELSADDYNRLLADMFIEKFPLLADRSLLGSPQMINAKAGDFYETAKQKLFTIIKPEEDRLKQLATARAQVIANYMVQQGIANERLFILDTVINPERDNKDISVILSLNSY
ncbi:MAG: DUF748 domain-containing protein [Methylococcales bacterium]|nr:DUF748 domain-containing protein [Methylococcales bacterium]